MRDTFINIFSRRLPLCGQPALWVFLIAFCIRLTVLVRFGDASFEMQQSGDMKFYHQWALRIAEGQLTDHQAFYGMPGYAYFLGLLYRLFSVEPFVMGLLQGASESLIAVLIYKLALKSQAPGSGKPAALLAAAGWVFFQPAQAFSVVLMPTTWLVLGFWAALFLASRTEATSYRWWGWLGIGLLTGATALMVATILLLVPLLITAVLKRAPARRIPAALLSLGAGLFLGTAPCWIHNYFVAKEPVLFSAHSGLNFYIGNNPLANGYPKIPPGMRAGQAGMLQDSITVAQEEAGRPLTRAEVSRHWSAKANAYIKTHPAQWLRLMGIKFRNFWNSFQYDDLGLITLFSAERVLTPGLRFGVVTILAVPGMLLGLLQFRRLGWVAGGVLLHLCALMPVFITERYRLAAVPGLLIFASVGGVLFWQALRTAKWRRALLYLGIAGVSFAFTRSPHSNAELQAVDDYNAGFRALETRKLDRAQMFLEKAYAQMSDNDEANFALGNLWMEKGEPKKAKVFYRRTLELNPKHGGAYNNLGVIALSENRWQVAESFLRRALASDPSDAKTCYLLAKARLGMDDKPGAMVFAQKAVSLEPQRKLFRTLLEELNGKPAP